MTKYVIVGNSAGGIGAAEAIRDIDKEGTITIVSEEPYPAYSRPMISKYLAGEATIEQMLYRNHAFYQENAITLLNGRKVIRIDLENRAVVLDNDECVAYDRLLLATGGRPIMPNLGAKEGIMTFINLADAKAIASRMGTARSAIVIGGGLIGVSVTDALVKKGIQVTIVELRDRLLNVMLDAEASHRMEKVLSDVGVSIVTSRSAVEVLGKDDDDTVAGGVRLDNGVELRADMVIMAIGVIPRTELARDAGINVNRGILVDRYMETSVPGVFACGDAVEAHDYLLGANRPIPIWPLAYVGGRVAGFNMAGKKTEYKGGAPMNSMNYFSLPIVSAGDINATEEQGHELLTATDEKKGSYKKLVLKDGKIVGLVFVKDIERSGIIHGLMSSGADVSSFKETLVAEGFSLASLPETLRREKLAGVAS